VKAGEVASSLPHEGHTGLTPSDEDLKQATHNHERHKGAEAQHIWACLEQPLLDEPEGSVAAHHDQRREPAHN
jgi:hypothetical protein